MNKHAKAYIKHAQAVKETGCIVNGKLSRDYIAMNKALKAYHRAKKSN